MAHTLKLDIYCFSIKRVKKTKEAWEDKKKNRNKPVWSNFEDFLSDVYCKEDEDVSSITKEEFFRRFMEDFINKFKDEFVLNSEGTKGMASDSFKLFPSKNKIDGLIKGGLTGIDQVVYDKSDATKSEDKIIKSKIAALPYYFKLWLPFDATVGVFMMQSYTSNGVNGLFIKQLRYFFNNKGYSFSRFKHVPEEYKEKFKKESKIYEVTFLKQKLGEKSRESLNSAFTSHDNLKVKLKFCGLNESPDTFFEKFHDKKYLNADLGALEMVNDDDYETVVSYRDANGHKSSARVSKNLDIVPTYFLPESLKQNGFEFADYGKIQKHTDHILEIVKKEINYSPVDVD